MWSVPRQVQIAAIFARNLIPLLGIGILGWSASKFLLLIVFNFSLNIALIGVAGATASTVIALHAAGKQLRLASVCMQASLIVLVLSMLITAMLGWPIYFQSSAPVFDRGWWLALLMTVLAPLPGVIADIRDSVAVRLSDERLKKIVKQREMLVIAGIVPIVALYWLIGDSRSVGTLTLAALYAALAIARDLRPDLAAELVGELST